MSIEGVSPSYVSITWLDWGKKRQAGICVWMLQFNSKLFAKCQPCESILWKINSQEILLSILDLSLSQNHFKEIYIYSQNEISHDIIFTHSLLSLSYLYDLNYLKLFDKIFVGTHFKSRRIKLDIALKIPFQFA